LEISSDQRVPALGVTPEALRPQTILPIEAIVSEYYLRITARDKPGVLSQISRILGDAGISIEAVIQKEVQPGETTVPLILLTSRIQEGILREAVKRIEDSAVAEGSVVIIRVETLDK